VTVLEAATDLLASRWRTGVTVREVLVDHQDRAVIRTVDPLARPVVVKADRDSSRLRREAQALTKAALAGVPVPAVLEQIDAAPALLVLEYVQGRSLRSTGRPEHWRQVGRQLRVLHDYGAAEEFPVFGGGTTWWGSMRWLAEHSHQWCRERRLLDPDTLDRLAALMREAFDRDDQPVGCLLHGDCGPDHWLLREDAVVAVVDFGDTGRGDPCWDLAVLTLMDRGRLPVVVDGYGMDRAMRDHLDAVLMPYTVVRHLLAVEWLVEHSFDPAPTIAELHRHAGRT